MKLILITLLIRKIKEVINLVHCEKSILEEYVVNFWFSRNYNFKITKEHNGAIFEN